MKTIITSVFSLLVVSASGAAIAESSNIDDTLSQLSYHNSGRDVRTGSSWLLENGTKVRKSNSRLRAKNSGICLTAKSKLDPGVYSSWWMIFNEPSECANPLDFGNGQKCGAGDLGNTATRATLMWAAPIIVGPNGVGRVNVCVAPGELSHAVFPTGTQEGIVFPKKAEYQLLIRNHGPGQFGDAALFGAQLNSIAGGCESDTEAGFPCETVQVILHPAKSNNGYDY